MGIDNRFFYYDTLTEVKRKTFAGCLAITDVTSGLVHWEEVKAADGDNIINFWGFVLEKSKTRYLLPVDPNRGFDLKSVFPIRIAKGGSRKVSYQGKGYDLIEDYKSINIIPKSTLSFRELVETLACFKHDNPEHYKLYWFIVLTQLLDRANFRIATPAGFGKNSAVNISNALNLSCGTIENPTFPKLKERAYRLKLLVLNEIIDVTKDNWRSIQQFLLAVGDLSPEFTNNSKSHGGLDEVIDISRLSLTLTYNDVDHYSDASTYFDTVAITAVKDRFVPLRLHGRMREDYNSIKGVDIAKLGEQYIPQYKELIANLIYYRENLNHHTKTFDDSKLTFLASERWRTSIHRLLKVISCYCKDQQEYDSWIDIINKAHIDYDAMKPYPTMLEKLKKRLSMEDFNREMIFVRQAPTFLEKNDYMEKLLKGERPVPNKDWEL